MENGRDGMGILTLKLVSLATLDDKTQRVKDEVLKDEEKSQKNLNDYLA
jgi:hypothetical protein